MNIEHAIPYVEIPHFPVSTVEGHQGRLLIGQFGNKNVIAMQGRFHYYEGYHMQEVTFPVRVMHALGVNILFVSNAAGGVNTSYQTGDLMIIRDHINLFPEHPLRGKNIDELGPRFPAMTDDSTRRKNRTPARHSPAKRHLRRPSRPLFRNSSRIQLDTSHRRGRRRHVHRARSYRRTPHGHGVLRNLRHHQ